VTAIIWRTHSLSRKTLEDRAIESALTVYSRARQLARETPMDPPERADLSLDAWRRADALYELQAMRMAAWRRRYLCLVPAISRDVLEGTGNANKRVRLR
jgi:hypothetical protein